MSTMINSLDTVLEGQMKAKGWKWSHLGNKLAVAFTLPLENVTDVDNTVRTFYPQTEVLEVIDNGVVFLDLEGLK